MSFLSITFDETGEATRLVRMGMFIIIVFVGGFFAWSILAPISGAVVAEGIVKIETKRKTVQHLDGGVIKDILGHEGEYVEQGQALLILEDAEVKANLTILRDQLHALMAKETRLMAEQRFADKLDFPQELLENADPKVRETLANEKTLFLTKKRSVDDSITVTRNEILNAKQEEASYTTQIQQIKESIRYKEERVAMGEALSAKQFVDKSSFMQWKEALADTRASLGQVEGRLASSRQQQAELELRIINLRNDYMKGADDELKQAKQELYEVQQKIRPAELAVQRFRVVSPSAGQVIDLKVSTIGGVVTPGQPLMDVVPKEQELLMEVKVKTTDIELVHVGQHADIQLLAYSSRSIPHVEGKVVYVSGDALEDPANSLMRYYFLAHIRMNGNALDGLSGVVLAAGMPVTAFIQTKSKTFFDIIFKKFEDSVSRGLRQET